MTTKAELFLATLEYRMQPDEMVMLFPGGFEVRGPVGAAQFSVAALPGLAGAWAIDPLAERLATGRLVDSRAVRYGDFPEAWK